MSVVILLQIFQLVQFISCIVEYSSLVSGVPPIKLVSTGLILLAAIPPLFFVRNENKYIVIWWIFLMTVFAEVMIFAMYADLRNKAERAYNEMEPTYEVQRKEWK